MQTIGNTKLDINAKYSVTQSRQILFKLNVRQNIFVITIGTHAECCRLKYPNGSLVHHSVSQKIAIIALALMLESCIRICMVSMLHICMYVCKKNLCLCRKKPYSLDCHGGTMGMYHCALENMTDTPLS